MKGLVKANLFSPARLFIIQFRINPAPYSPDKHPQTIQGDIFTLQFRGAIGFA
jgi:hypothetical protein